MPLTQFDDVAALLVIDLHERFRDAKTIHPVKDVVSSAATLLEAFRESGRPVVLVRVNGHSPGRTDRPPSTAAPASDQPLMPELDPQQSDLIVTKTSWGAFTGTGLAEWLTARSVTQVVLVGIATSIGVESTARQAHEAGFNVVVVTDAVTDVNQTAHDNSLSWVFPRLAETCSTEDVLVHLHGAT